MKAFAINLRILHRLFALHLRTLSFSTDKDKESNLTLEKLHDLAVDMARKKRHQLLDRHFSAIETVASVQENWNSFIEPPFSQISVDRISNRGNVTFADEDDENNSENRLNREHSKGRFRSLGNYRSSGPVRRRASERELDELKRNRDDIDIDAKKQEFGRSRFATFGGSLPGGEQALLVRQFRIFTFITVYNSLF